MDIDVFWTPGMTLDEVEKRTILKAFRHYRGNKTTTANVLKIAIRTLDNKLKSYEQGKTDQEKIDEQDKKRRDDFILRQRGFVLNENGECVLLNKK